MKRRVVITYLAWVICLILLGSGTYAWLSHNLNSSANNATIQLDYKGISIVGFNVYKYDPENNVVVNITDEDTYTMTPYDSIFPNGNNNSALLFEADLAGNFNADTYLTLSCTNPTPGGYTARKTSNVVHIKAVQAQSITELSENPTDKEKYDTVVKYFKNNVSSSECFVKLSGGTFDHKDYTIKYKLNLTETQKQLNEIRVYFIVDYDLALLTAQGIPGFADVGILYSDPVEFDDDITTVRFVTGSYEE